MELIEKKSQSRRDFVGIYKCEECGNIEEHRGCYDDRNFHDNVSPHWKCKKCGKSTIDLGLKPKFIQTKYREYEIV